MRLLCKMLALASFALAPLVQVQAEDFPSKPLTLLTPYAPGTLSDITGRVMSEQLSAVLKQRIIVVNKPGAFGIMAMNEMMRQPADGYTLMIGNVSTNAVTPVLYPGKMSFDYARSIAPVSELGAMPTLLLVTTTDFKPRSLKEVVAYAKANPGKLRYATPGLGSFPQFDTEMLARRAHVTMLHVPLKDGNIANNVANGDTQLAFINVASAAPMMKAGKLVPVAVNWPTPLPNFPGIPTFAEAGYPGVGTTLWEALYIRADTPKPVMDTLFAAVKAAMLDGKTRKSFADLGFDIALSPSLAAARAWQDRQIRRWQQIVAETHISLD